MYGVAAHQNGFHQDVYFDILKWQDGIDGVKFTIARDVISIETCRRVLQAVHEGGSRRRAGLHAGDKEPKPFLKNIATRLIWVGQRDLPSEAELLLWTPGQRLAIMPAKPS